MFIKKTTLALIVIVIFVALSLIFVVVASNNKNVVSNKPQEAQQADIPPQEESKPAPVQEKTPEEKMSDSLIKLVDSGKAFDAGSYIKGDIPKGEYAFITYPGAGQYYGEEDSAGEIVDNENFDAFGYVYVQGVGNIETGGLLVRTDSFEAFGVKGAKELYEKLNFTGDYKGSAWYKVGLDIKPGRYTIKSVNDGYVAVMSGPVGKNEIIDNEIFNGRYSVKVSRGQYLVVSGGEIE